MVKETLIQEMQQEKVIAIARGLTTEQVVAAAKALYEGGIRFMEVTFDATGKVSNDETGKMIAGIVKELDGNLEETCTRLQSDSSGCLFRRKGCLSARFQGYL